MAKKVATTVYITDRQQVLLKELHERSKVPIAEYVRQGIDLVLEKYKTMLPGQMDLLSDLPEGEAQKKEDSNSKGGDA